MRFTSKELAIIEVLAKQQKAGNQQITLSDIVEGTGPKVDPEETQVNFRGGIAATMRNLQRKVGVLGVSIYPNGVVGRGNQATYRVIGDLVEAVKKIERSMMAEFRVKYSIVGEQGTCSEDVVAKSPDDAATIVRKREKDENGRSISVITTKKIKNVEAA